MNKYKKHNKYFNYAPNGAGQPTLRSGCPLSGRYAL